MKKFLFTMSLLGALLCGMNPPLAAQTLGSNWSCCDEWSIGDGKFTLGADWLYWKTTEDNLDAYVVSSSDNACCTRVERPKHKYESGYRIYLGYELPCDCWDVGLLYTNIPSTA